MAQRGGSVSTTVRFGEKVTSMVSGARGADVILSLEVLESIRNLPLLAPDGHLVSSMQVIEPMSVLSGMAKYGPPTPRACCSSLGEGRASLVDAEDLARRAGNPRCSNVALLGAAARHLPIEEGAWREAIEGRVPPKTIEAGNVAAFTLGFTSGE